MSEQGKNLRGSGLFSGVAKVDWRSPSGSESIQGAILERRDGVVWRLERGASTGGRQGRRQVGSELDWVPGKSGIRVAIGCLGGVRCGGLAFAGDQKCGVGRHLGKTGRCSLEAGERETTGVAKAVGRSG